MQNLDKINLIAELDRYGAKNYAQIYLCLEIEKFIIASRDPFDRNNKEGHITAGGLVVHNGFVLLNHHKKLNKLIGFGGHADSEEENPFEIALREVREETGIQNIVSSGTIFDLDKFIFRHDSILPPHTHYDFRYLFEAQSKDIVKSDESENLIWMSIPEALEKVGDVATRRMIIKYRNLLNEKNALQNTQEK